MFDHKILIAPLLESRVIILVVPAIMSEVTQGLAVLVTGGFPVFMEMCGILFKQVRWG